MKPIEIVQFLDLYIIGQTEAKRTLANALRNRWRRRQLPDDLKDDIIPKNILMIGPTGCGKTEIARRLAKLVNAPFIKVEATKYTEVGFHGKDVDSIIKDLVEISIRNEKSRLENEVKKKAQTEVEEDILIALVGSSALQEDRETWTEHLRAGLLDDRDVRVNVPIDEDASSPLASFSGIGIGLEGKQFQIVTDRQKYFSKKTMTVRDARKKLLQNCLDKLIDSSAVVTNAIRNAEQEGIVFIDEIDKICHSKKGYYGGSDASAEGVQRDLLPVIEGCEITTKHGPVNTNHILFICAGAFHSVKPSDMLSELQGRLPVTVTLKPLTQGDFKRILTEPHNNLIFQQIELLRTEGVVLVIEEDAIEEIARIAFEINTHAENTGARRLYTIIEKIMDTISFDAPSMKTEEEVVLTSELVKEKLSQMLNKRDLTRYII